MESSDIEDCTTDKVPDSTLGGYLNKQTEDLQCELPPKFVTFRKSPSQRSNCFTPSYVEIAFRSLRSDSQNSMRYFGRCNHAAVDTITDDSLLDSSSACSRTPSQNSYFDFRTVAYNSTTDSLSHKSENVTIDTFLDQRDHRNSQIPAKYYQGTYQISRNIMALDLSSARSSLNQALKEPIQINSGDFQPLVDRLQAFSAARGRRGRSGQRRRSVTDLKRSSSQSRSWHSGCSPIKRGQDYNFFRILLSRDFGWIHDSQQSISSLPNNTSETEEILHRETESESCIGDAMLQDSQTQTRSGYLQKIVDLASRFFGWMTEERLSEDTSGSHGNVSFTGHEPSSLSVYTSRETNSDTTETSYSNSQNTSQQQRSEQEQNTPQRVDSVKSSTQEGMERINIFQILRKQLGEWTKKRMGAQETRPLLYEVDLLSNTFFTEQKEFSLAIHNGVMPFLEDSEDIIAKYDFGAVGRPKWMNLEYDEDNTSLDGQGFANKKITKQKISPQGRGLKLGAGEGRGHKDKAHKRFIERGNRRTWIPIKENTRKLKHWYMHKNKLKRKMLRARDGIKYLAFEGARDAEQEESNVEEESVTREHVASEDDDDFGDGDDADGDKRETEEEEKEEEEEDEQEQEEKGVKQEQQQQDKRAFHTEDMSSDEISDSENANVTYQKLNKSNVKKWKNNITVWSQKRKHLLTSDLPKAGEQTQVAGLRKVRKDQTNSLKPSQANSDSQSTERDQEESVVGTNSTPNIARGEGQRGEMKNMMAEDKTLLKEKPPLFQENVKENADSEKHSQESDPGRDSYFNFTAWKNFATQIRKGQSNLFRYTLKPQIGDHKDSAFLMNRTKENERKRISENLERCHVARKSFFVNTDIETKETCTDRTRDNWLQEKYRSNNEEQKLLTSDQTAKTDNGEEKHKMLKDIFMKMDEIASGDNRNEKQRDAMSLDKWISLLETLVQVNEKADAAPEANNEKKKERNMTTRRPGIDPVGDDLQSGRADILQLGRRPDVNLNKEILDWMEGSQGLRMNKGSPHKHRKKETTEMKHRERTAANVASHKSHLERGSTILDLDEIEQKNALAQKISNQTKRGSSSYEYQMWSIGETRSKYHRIMETGKGTAGSTNNGEKNANNDTVEDNENYEDIKSAQSKEYLLEDFASDEQKENAIESFARNKQLESVPEEDLPITEVTVDDKQVVRKNTHKKSDKNKRTKKLFAKDKSREQAIAAGNSHLETRKKGNSEGDESKTDYEIELKNESDEANSVSTFLNKNTDEKNTENIAAPFGGETRKEIALDETMTVPETSEDVSEIKRSQLDLWKGPEATNIDTRESERTNIDTRESERTNIDTRGSERTNIDTRKSERSVVSDAVQTPEDSDLESSVNEHVQRSGQLDESTMAIDGKASTSGLGEGGMAVGSLFSDGIVGSTGINFLKQRIIEEIEKFSARNVRPVVDIPEKRSLMQLTQAQPMFISRKTLDKVDEFLGLKVSSWLVPEGAAISEECSSSHSNSTQHQESGTAPPKPDPNQLVHPEVDAHLEASFTQRVPNPDQHKLVENNRELTFYQPLLPIPAQYRCSCIDCWKNVRGGRPPSRRMRSRRTLLSSDNFRCKVTRNRSQPDTRHSRDAWAKSDLERSSHIKPNKRIYSERLFRKKISVKNILQMCSKSAAWRKQPEVPSDKLNITAEDCNKHDMLCLAACLNAGDFNSEWKDDGQPSPYNNMCHDMQADPKMAMEQKHYTTSDDSKGLDSCSSGFAYLSDHSHKSDHLQSHKYDSCTSCDYLHNSRGYNRSSSNELPLSQLSAGSVKKQCSFSTSFDHCPMNHFFPSTKYASAAHPMTWPAYQLSSVRCPCSSYHPENTYSSRRLSSNNHHCKSCPTGLDPNNCYSSPLLTRYSYTPASTSWLSTVSTSYPYSYSAFNPRRPAPAKYCSGCDLPSSSSSPFRTWAGHFNFSIHNYV